MLTLSYKNYKELLIPVVKGESSHPILPQIWVNGIPNLQLDHNTKEPGQSTYSTIVMALRGTALLIHRRPSSRPPSVLYTKPAYSTIMTALRQSHSEQWMSQSQVSLSFSYFKPS